jgi:hypothetical protein
MEEQNKQPETPILEDSNEHLLEASDGAVEPEVPEVSPEAGDPAPESQTVTRDLGVEAAKITLVPDVSAEELDRIRRGANTSNDQLEGWKKPRDELGSSDGITPGGFKSPSGHIAA